MIYALIVVVGVGFFVHPQPFTTNADCKVQAETMLREAKAAGIVGTGFCGERADMLKAFAEFGLTDEAFPSTMGDGVKGVPVPAVEPARLSGRTPLGTFA